MRHIRLTEEEKDELEALRKNSPNLVVRERSSMLLLSSNGLCVNEIALLFNHMRHTVSRVLSTWENRGNEPIVSVLSVKSGRGARAKLSPVAHLLPQLVENHNRNLKPVLAILEKDHKIKVSKQTLRNFLKGTGLQVQTGATVAERQTRPSPIRETTNGITTT